MLKILRGGCHCGAIKVVLSTSKNLAAFSPRVDQCGFCVRHSAAVVSDPEGEMILEFPVPPPLPYRFGLEITDFHICARCGVYVAASWLDGPDRFGVVNINALDERAAFTGAHIETDFSGEDVAARSARRRQAWTPMTVRQRD